MKKLKLFLFILSIFILGTSIVSAASVTASTEVGINASCTGTPWGTILSGRSVTAWSSSSAVSTSTCTSQVRTCTDGSLSGSYAYTSCTQKYRASFSLNGGSPSYSSQVHTPGSTVSSPGSPSKTGYHFTGWSPALPTSMPSVNTTYTAQWGANTYHITFNGNGNTGGSTATEYFTYKQTKALTSNGFYKTGYRFLGWATSSGGGVSYGNRANYTMGAGNVTLYAKWGINRYTLSTSKKLSGSTTGIGTITGAGTYNYKTNVTVTESPSTGYHFTGWSGSCSGTGSCVVSMTTNRSVTANFAINRYMLRF